MPRRPQRRWPLWQMVQQPRSASAAQKVLLHCSTSRGPMRRGARDVMSFTRPMPLPSNSLSAWIFAAGAFLVAVAIRFAFIDVLPTGTAYAAFIPAIILVSYFSGLL